MKSTRAIFLAALMAVGFGGIIKADGCCGSGCGTTSNSSSCCCGCELTCCDDGDCCSTGSQACEDVCGGCATAKDVLLPFSQGENTARRYAGVAHLQNMPDQEDWNWHLEPISSRTEQTEFSLAKTTQLLDLTWLTFVEAILVCLKPSAEH
jgi:hypothetical protein